MAQGDLTLFNAFSAQSNDGTHDMDTHAFKVAFINNTTAPIATDVTPALADYTECSAGGNYTAGGFAMTVSPSSSTNQTTYDFTTDIAMAAHASNPTDVAYALIYNDTNVGKEAIGFVELNTAGFDATTGAVNVNWNATGVVRFTV